MKEKVAICKSPSEYYMCGSSIPEKIGSLEDVENYVKTDWELNVKRMAKYRNL